MEHIRLACEVRSGAVCWEGQEDYSLLVRGTDGKIVGYPSVLGTARWEGQEDYVSIIRVPWGPGVSSRYMIISVQVWVCPHDSCDSWDNHGINGGHPKSPQDNNIIVTSNRLPWTV